MLLDVDYAEPTPDLHTELFVKFSRDFDDPVRDRGRTQMESEVKFASLSLSPGFPIAVPRAQFADYHRDTGTGILISQRIQFGANGIEQQYHKCLDYEMPRARRPLPRADARRRPPRGRTSIRAAARRLTSEFPVDLQAAAVGEPPPLTPDKLRRRLTRLAEFAETHPGLLPANVRSPEFLARLADEAPQVMEQSRPSGATSPRRATTSPSRIGMPTSTTRGSGQTARRTAMRPDGLGLRQPVEPGDGDLGCDVGSRNRLVERPFRRASRAVLRRGACVGWTGWIPRNWNGKCCSTSH